MSAKSPIKTPTSGNNSRVGLIVYCDSKQIHLAAKTNPKLAKLLEKTPIQDLNDDEQAFTTLEPKDRDDIVEEWEEAIRSEAKTRPGKRHDGSSWLDNFSIIKLGGPSKSDHRSSGIRFESLEENDEKKEQEKIKHAKAEPPSRNYRHVLDPDFIKALEAIGIEEPVDHSMLESSSSSDESDSMTTAEKLLEAVNADESPLDPLTRQQFGFAKVNNHEEETCVLGLYIGLFVHLPRPPTPDMVEDWVTKNELAQHIQEMYERQTMKGSSGYFHWFLKNKHFFDQNFVNPNGPKAAPEHGTCINRKLFEELTGRAARRRALAAEDSDD